MTAPNAASFRSMESADDGCAHVKLKDTPAVTSVTRTLRLKVKSESYRWLTIAAMEVNTVWNWSAEVSEQAGMLVYEKA